MQGGSAADRAAIFREILAGGKKRKGEAAEHSAIKDYIIINAAPAIYLAGKAKTFEAAADIARAALEDGSALKVLDKYIALSNKMAPAHTNGVAANGVFSTRLGHVFFLLTKT